MSAAELIGTIMAQNAADASFITNQLLEAKDEQILELAKAIKSIGVILDQATVIDRKTEYRLAALDYEFVRASHIIRDRESSL